MNETVIKALVAQAGNQMDKVPAHDPAYAELAKLLVKQDNKVLKAFNRMIIELTVRECMEQVWYSREDGINGNVSEVIKARMAEHFGVTE